MRNEKLENNISYQPSNLDNNVRHLRNVSLREELLQCIDYQDKYVLDIGCNRGFFSYFAANNGANVIGIDADADVIKTNIAESSSDNVNFHLCDALEFISLAQENNKKYHIVLCLSVIHHLIAESSEYEVNKSRKPVQLSVVLNTLGNITDTLIIEPGMPNEGYEWSRSLPYTSAVHFKELLDHQLSPLGFSGRVIEPKDNIKSLSARLLLGLAVHGNIFNSIAKRRYGLDIRDVRPIYIYTKSNNG